MPQVAPAPHVIRGLVGKRKMFHLRELVERRYVEAQAEALDEPDLAESLVWGGLGLGRTGEEILGAIAPIEVEIAARFPGASLVPSVSAFRRITRRTYIFWHMDADGTGSWAHDPVVNCWIPLADVGRDGSPSLELLVNSEPLMRRVGIDPPGHRPDSWVEENLPQAESWIPQLRMGDCLVFSHYILHRTQPMERLSGPRIGMELRFALREPQKAPKAQVSWKSKLRRKIHEYTSF